MGPVLVDTTVLVYAAEASDPAKHAAAVGLLARLDPLRVVVPAQVLAEYSSVLTHPATRGIAGREVARAVARMASAWRVLPLDADVVLAALGARDRWGLAYYDAQIWAAAALHAVPLVLSEDFASGVELGEVRFENPFAPGFDAT